MTPLSVPSAKKEKTFEIKVSLLSVSYSKLFQLQTRFGGLLGAEDSLSSVFATGILASVAVPARAVAAASIGRPQTETETETKQQSNGGVSNLSSSLPEAAA